MPLPSSTLYYFTSLTQRDAFLIAGVNSCASLSPSLRSSRSVGVYLALSCPVASPVHINENFTVRSRARPDQEIAKSRLPYLSPTAHSLLL